MEREVHKLYLRYDWTVDFLELPNDINDVIFCMECRYRNEDYPNETAL